VPQANLASLTNQFLTTGHPPLQIIHSLRNFNANAPEFRSESTRLANEADESE
jgi:hypothetical protein